MVKRLHIVTHTIPYPVTHGGLFDPFYKIIALKSAGVSISLHCFADNNHQHDRETLKHYCDEVHFYQREKGVAGLSLRLPFIVSSRSSRALLENLLKDNEPVLLEGIHCTYLLNDHRFSGRKILLRLHNVEHEYYRALFENETALLKKIYFLVESRLLKEYEKRISLKPSVILAVSERDIRVYRRSFGARNMVFLPVFSGFRQTAIVPGSGKYCLYHGNLSISENKKAALWLALKVFRGLNIPLVIAGRNPSRAFVSKLERYPWVRLVANPPDAEMEDLIRDAQCHLLPSFNTTGVKLKLINALYNGRHCLANNAAVAGSGLGWLCQIANTVESFRNMARILFSTPFTEKDVESRSGELKKVFDTERDVMRLIRMLW